MNANTRLSANAKNALPSLIDLVPNFSPQPPISSGTLYTSMLTGLKEAAAPLSDLVNRYAYALKLRAPQHTESAPEPYRQLLECYMKLHGTYESLVAYLHKNTDPSMIDPIVLIALHRRVQSCLDTFNSTLVPSTTTSHSSPPNLGTVADCNSPDVSRQHLSSSPLMSPPTSTPRSQLQPLLPSPVKRESVLFKPSFRDTSREARVPNAIIATHHRGSKAELLDTTTETSGGKRKRVPSTIGQCPPKRSRSLSTMTKDEEVEHAIEDEDETNDADISEEADEEDDNFDGLNLQQQNGSKKITGTNSAGNVSLHFREHDGSASGRRCKSADQLSILEEEYKISVFPSTTRRASIAKATGLTPRSVQIWFQNKRAKDKAFKRQQELLKEARRQSHLQQTALQQQMAIQQQQHQQQLQQAQLQAEHAQQQAHAARIQAHVARQHFELQQQQSRLRIGSGSADTHQVSLTIPSRLFAQTENGDTCSEVVIQLSVSALSNSDEDQALHRLTLWGPDLLVTGLCTKAQCDKYFQSRYSASQQHDDNGFNLAFSSVSYNKLVYSKVVDQLHSARMVAVLQHPEKPETLFVSSDGAQLCGRLTTEYETTL
eukprot:TRINITY_DN3028_c1_g1_i1.p1 TRINITY_DN3028_c1_g1~~TRINITY_DN3028_c1_g1_i1.p1  ORF type:complete len:602 (-),score=89.28 TRINITY_DN3028_c1_g1_i1:78-1883(-)